MKRSSIPMCPQQQSTVAFTPKGGCPLKQESVLLGGDSLDHVAFTPKGGSDKGTTVWHGIAEAEMIFPARARTGRRAVLPSPPLSPSPASRERGIMECGSEASAHAEANASALQKGRRVAPLSHRWERGTKLIRVHRFGTESLRQGRFSPRGRERVGAPCCPNPLCPPLP